MWAGGQSREPNVHPVSRDLMGDSLLFVALSGRARDKRTYINEMKKSHNKVEGNRKPEDSGQCTKENNS